MRRHGATAHRVLVTVAIILSATATTTASVAADADRTAGPVRLNDLQVVGTHNSYHVEPTPEALAVITAVEPSLADLAVTHPPVREQLEDQSVRQVELDVFADPDGSLWRPIGTTGFKVFHMEQIDEGSNCEVFVDCLRELRRWSDAHARHLPVFVLVQPQAGITLPGPPNPVPLTTESFDALDAEIRSVMVPATWSYPIVCGARIRRSKPRCSRVGGRRSPPRVEVRVPARPGPRGLRRRSPEPRGTGHVPGVDARRARCRVRAVPGSADSGRSRNSRPGTSGRTSCAPAPTFRSPHPPPVTSPSATRRSRVARRS